MNFRINIYCVVGLYERLLGVKN